MDAAGRSEPVSRLYGVALAADMGAIDAGVREEGCFTELVKAKLPPVIDSCQAEAEQASSEIALRRELETVPVP